MTPQQMAAMLTNGELRSVSRLVRACMSVPVYMLDTGKCAECGTKEHTKNCAIGKVIRCAYSVERIVLEKTRDKQRQAAIAGKKRKSKKKGKR
mgnify:CR=1 FL=1